MSLRYGAASDVGRMRDGNQDSFLRLANLAAVADGMGGRRGGDVASAAAVEELRSLEHDGPWASPAQATEALRMAVGRANRRIMELAARDRSLDGMGTTLTAVLQQGDLIHLASVGDSRAYLLRQGELSQVTVDHTLVQQLVDEGRLRPEDAERHPQRSVITRALGLDPDVEVDLFTYRLQAGDRVLLCTDGLSGVVTADEIRDRLLRLRDPQQAADRLVALANEHGGPDNVTVIVLDYERQGGDVTGELPGVATGGAARRDAELIAGLARVGPGDGAAASRSSRLRRSRRGRGRKLLVALLVLAVLAAAAVVGRNFLLSRYWVGFDGDEVTIFRGVPGDVAGLRLSEVVESSGVTRSEVPDSYASRLEDGISADSLADARRIAQCAPLVFSRLGCDGAAATTTTLPTTTTGG